jgi:N-acetylmuramoyl-L-alanine amidase
VIKPDNATGNFTKVVQRLPTRITLDPGQDGVDPPAAGHERGRPGRYLALAGNQPHSRAFSTTTLAVGNLKT